MKKGILLLVSILFFGISAGAQGPVSGVDIDEPTLDLHPGDEPTLTATLTPNNPDDPAVVWTSTDSATVDITSNGLTCNLKAMKAGSATIKVKTTVGGYEASCVVTVTVPVTKVTIQKDNSDVTDTIKVVVGNTVALTPKVEPVDATNKNVEWGTKNSSIATVNNGVVTFTGVGTTKIYVKTVDGEFTDTCVVRGLPILVNGLIISKKNHEMVKGSEFQLSATITPANATDRSVEWISVDPAKVTVDATGKVKAISTGTDIKVIVKTKDGSDKKDTCKITVIDSVYVTSIKLSKDTLRMDVGNEENLTADVKPNNATEKGVKWSVTNNNYATVDNGKVAAIKAISKMYVIAETKDGGLKDTCVLIINNKDVTGIKLDKDTVRLALGDSVLLKATVTPSNATDKSVKWEPKDSKIATVKDGLVKTIAIGETSIYVTSNSNTKIKDTCIVIVSAQVIPVTSVQIKDSIGIIEEDTIKLIASILPTNATNKKVTWKSENTTIATVDANGIITAKKAGETKIIVTTDNSSKRDTCVVTVREKVILIDPVIPAQGNKGSIPLKLNAPDKETLTGVFTVVFPAGVTIDEENTKLAEAFAASSKLSITPGSNNTWKIEIKKNELKSMLLALSEQKIIDIAYTITKNVKKGDLLDVNIKDAAFKFTDNTEIKEESMTFKLKADFTTSNNIIDGEKAYAYTVDNRLYVQSAKAETIYVYSLNGTLLYSGEKAEGKVAVDLNIQEPIIIVKGSSGWIQKVAK